MFHQGEVFFEDKEAGGIPGMKGGKGGRGGRGGINDDGGGQIRLGGNSGGDGKAN